VLEFDGFRFEEGQAIGKRCAALLRKPGVGEAREHLEPFSAV
jgi:hypothetical protein